MKTTFETWDEAQDYCKKFGLFIPTTNAFDGAESLKQAYQFGVDEQRRRWASFINSLACIIIDGEITSNDLDLANDVIEEVVPYLEPDF